MDELKGIMVQYMESMSREITMLHGEITILREMNDQLRQNLCDMSARVTRLEIENQCDLK